MVSSYLQQQKFVWLISQEKYTLKDYDIYNSRNSFGLLANKINLLVTIIPSTIVEIRLAYQPALPEYDRLGFIYNSRNSFGLLALKKCLVQRQNNLQQQKFVWLISPQRIRGRSQSQSTIVEIHLAYQPCQQDTQGCLIYNSRNSFGLLAYTYDRRNF